MIVYNAIKCNNCKEVIQSRHNHDFIKCKCDECGVDGGLSYLRRLGSNYIELSLYSIDRHEDIREVMTWGQNYDKDKNLLSKTNWILIKNLNQDHLLALIEYTKSNIELNEIFRNELEYRNKI